MEHTHYPLMTYLLIHPMQTHRDSGTQFRPPASKFGVDFAPTDRAGGSALRLWLGRGSEVPSDPI